ncbi:MAG: hypothetical protein M3165_04310 [Actinomycetota bacterium]|nr:hypothetical protein [Actinomycetota bacterium]
MHVVWVVEKVQLAAAQPAPAGGAALDQVLIAAGFTAVVYAALAWVMWRERRGGDTSPSLVGRVSERVAAADGGSPRWFLAPMLVQVAGALSGAVGLYWDVSFHISQGRDEGPLANPAHYLIFFGLIAMFLGGALALALADHRLPARSLRVTRSWRVPVGPALSTGIALCALAGFPLDDLWHRLFGQDVTEWGPTHIVMIGGTILLPYSMLLTCAETRQIGAPSRIRTLLEHVALVIVFIGPVAFLLEYAYGVPQFPLVMDPIVLALAATMTMTLAMLRGRRWVVSTWVGFALLQTGLVVLNVWGFDALPPWPPLLLGGALTALLLARVARPTYLFGVLGGAAVAAVTVGSEYFWAQEMRPMPWPAEAMPYALLWGTVTGAVVGVVAVWLHTRLHEVGHPAAGADAGAHLRRGRHPHVPALVAVAVLVAVIGYNAPPRDDLSAGGQAGARLSFDDVASAQRRTAYVEAAVHPRGLTHDAWWFEALSWQGGGLVKTEMTQVSPGVFRSERPLPLHGTWKTMLRLHLPVHTMVSVPIYLPADPAIPAHEVPAVQGADREFVAEKHILRREEREDVPPWLWATGYAVTFALFGLVFALIAAAYALAARRPRRPRVESAPAPAPVGADT